jgi:hypothetical protein
VVDAETKSTAYDRSVGQVLSIVHGALGSVAIGLFFPAGAKGNTNTSG